MYRFLSEGWIKEYAREWNGNEKLRENLRDFSASIKYFIEGKERDAVHLIVEKGYRQGKLGRRTLTKYDFELWASPENWKRLATGEMGPRGGDAYQKAEV
ncbi:MAG: SCP2 sterol-binding domain-containing protein [Aquificota bacterium]|nr:SCP2 sterol-binding domain-containing protein [Aquificota bacterium]